MACSRIEGIGWESKERRVFWGLTSKLQQADMRSVVHLIAVIKLREFRCLSLKYVGYS